MKVKSSAGSFAPLGRFPLFVVFFVIFFVVFCAWVNSSSYAHSLGFKKLVNEVSLYQNRYDCLLDIFDKQLNAGQTLQIVSINSLKLGTWLNLEFTYDLNYDLEKENDFTYYLEVGLVKEIFPRFSINYQRIHGTFMDKPVNQFGIRFSF